MKRDDVAVFVGIGSNLGDRRARVERAIAGLSKLPWTSLVASSGLCETVPMGPQDQPAFINACVALRTGLTPHALLEAMHTIERSMGRERSAERRWGPRPIDLDLLLYADETIDEPGLRVPHPRMHERRFVLEPLAEIAPEAVHPVLECTVARLLECLEDTPEDRPAGSDQETSRSFR